jgi:hypothetical protein
MAFKADLNFDTAKLRSIIKKKQDLLSHNIFTTARSEAIPHLIDLIMDGYDRLSDRMSVMPEDPTHPGNWRTEFKNKLHEELERNLIVSDKGLIVRLGEKEFLGYTENGELGDPTDSTPLVWMVYYIEGLLGEWAFISADVYERFRGKPLDATAGRFGQGFMISRRAFDEEGWNSVTTFDEVRHPFSGTSPLDIFTEALNEFKMRPFVEKAIKAAEEGRRL